MSESPARQKAHLRAIARQAMLDRQLEPDFPPAALPELARIPGAAHPDAAGVARPGAPAAAPIRDLRARPWCSIDNDDSRDLCHLSVAHAHGQRAAHSAAPLKILLT